jgi:threonine/homoserine/homoserine lactone efflux protein
VQGNQERLCRNDPATNEKEETQMEWGRFLQVIGSIFATAGLVMLMLFKYVLEADAPDGVMASFGLGLGVVLLGALVIYAIPKKNE